MYYEAEDVVSYVNNSFLNVKSSSLKGAVGLIQTFQKGKEGPDTEAD